jgi:hypothetical protein
MIQDAMRAFEGHHLILDDRKNGRWRIARKYDDGAIRSDMATEIISLWGGRLFVGGDIDDCVFGYCSGPKDQTEEEFHAYKLCWMGRCQDVGYYVRQKAAIGMTDNHKLIDRWESKVAVYELQQMYHERRQEADNDGEDPDKAWSEDDTEVIEEAIRMAHDADHEYEVTRHLYHNLSESFEVIPTRLGMVMSTRAVYAWAALWRLCEMLYGPIQEDLRGDLCP